MVVNLVLSIDPLRIACGDVMMPETAWERYSHAHLGSSVSEFLLACERGEVD